MCVTNVFLTLFLISVCNLNTHTCHQDFVSNKQFNKNNKDTADTTSIESKKENNNRNNNHRVRRDEDDEDDDYEEIFWTTPGHYNPKKWSEERKRAHSIRMREYWKEHRQKGNPFHEENYARRRRLMSISMRDYWARYKTEEGGGERYAKHAQKMIEYWRREKEAGNKSHSEKMIQYWRKIKRDNDTDRINLQKKIMEDYWIKLEKKGNKDKYLKEVGKKLKAKWKKIKEEGNTKQSAIMKTYWKKLIETGKTERLQKLKEYSRLRRKYWNTSSRPSH